MNKKNKNSFKSQAVISTSPVGDVEITAVASSKDESLQQSSSCYNFKEIFQSKQKLNSSFSQNQNEEQSSSGAESSSLPRKQRKLSNWTKFKNRYLIFFVYLLFKCIQIIVIKIIK